MAFNFNLQKQPTLYSKTPAVFKGHPGVPLPNSTQKTKLTKKFNLEGFKVTDLVWMRPSDGRHKLEVLVRYIDPEQPRTKRNDGSYQKIIKFGQKGVYDYTDLPHLQQTREKIHARLKMNTDNPLHSNFYVRNVLNGPTTDAYENFKLLKRQLFT